MADFSPVRVSEAITLLNHSSDPFVKHESNEFLLAWVDSPNIHQTSYELLTSSHDPQVQFTSACVFKNSILTNWLKFPVDWRTQAREFFVGVINQDITPLLMNPICEIVSVIAFYDYPDHWPSFLDFILASTPDHDPYFGHKVSIFSFFVGYVCDPAPLLESQHYGQAVDVLIALDSYLQFVLLLLSRPDTITAGVSFCTKMVPLAGILQLLPEPVYLSLLGVVEHYPEHRDCVFECLETCMVERSEIVPDFSSYSSLLLRVFAALPEYTPAGIRLIAGFLSTYWMRILLLIVNFGVNVVGSRLQFTEVRQRRWTSALSHEQYCSDLVRVLQNLLQCCPTEENLERYWHLWQEVARGATPDRCRVKTGNVLAGVIPALLPSLSRWAFTLVDKCTLLLPGLNVVFGLVFSLDVPRFLEKRGFDRHDKGRRLRTRGNRGRNGQPHTTKDGEELLTLLSHNRVLSRIPNLNRMFLSREEEANSPGHWCRGNNGGW
jgi:hypothetical protein